jgi:hypothetical protein
LLLSLLLYCLYWWIRWYHPVHSTYSWYRQRLLHVFPWANRRKIFNVMLELLFCFD